MRGGRLTRRCLTRPWKCTMPGERALPRALRSWVGRMDTLGELSRDGRCAYWERHSYYCP
eukprot:scaffold106766_cov63-Phaeocystis_antarctica.AAC.2